MIKCGPSRWNVHEPVLTATTFSIICLRMYQVLALNNSPSLGFSGAVLGGLTIVLTFDNQKQREKVTNCVITMLFDIIKKNQLIAE